MPKRSLEDIYQINNILEQNRQENALERGRAKGYFNSTKTPGNLVKAAYHYWKSNPYLGGKNENNIVIKGDPILPYTSNIINLNTLNSISKTLGIGKKATASLNIANILKGNPIISKAKSLNSNTINLAAETNWTKNLPGVKDYSYTKVEPYSGYTKVTQSEKYKDFVDDVNQTVGWVKDRGKPNPIKSEIIDINDLIKINGGAESSIYLDPRDKNKVFKVLYSDLEDSSIGYKFKNKNDALRKAIDYTTKRNKVLYNMPLSVEGVVQKEGGFYQPVLSQRKLQTLVRDKLNKDVVDKIKKLDKSVRGMLYYPDGYTGRINNILHENDIIEAISQYGDDFILRGRDFNLNNLGLLENGNIIGIDLYNKGGKISLTSIR